MILDAQLLLSNAQAVTAAAASTNHIDLSAIRNMGVGQVIFIHVNCDVAMTDTGSNSTLAVTIETDDNSAFSTATSVQTIGTFAATSAIGTRIVARLAVDAINERYMRLYYTPANGDLSAGSFTAVMALDVQAYTSYADAITITG